MAELPQKRPSAAISSDAGAKRRKRVKKNPYGGDIYKQIAAAYTAGTNPWRKTRVTEETETDVANEDEHADDGMADGMVGDEKFFPDRRMLPVWKARHEILTALEHNNVLILTGEAGSGKSTQVPQILRSAPWCTKMIAVTQPRRIAATSLAYRVAAEMGTPLKNKNTGLVGYSVRFDTLVPKGTRIKYLTEGMLLQEFSSDRSLSKYSAVIVDEVHERSTNVDLVMGFLRLLMTPSVTQDTDTKGDNFASSEKRPSGERLKVVLMSATADVETLHKFFSTGTGERWSEAGQASAKANTRLPEQQSETSPTASTLLNEVKVIRVSGRQYPIEIIYEKETRPFFVDSMAEKVVTIHKTEQYPGDILAFLPGQDEIHQVSKIIKKKTADLPSNVPRLEVLPLYSQLPKKQQDKALVPSNRPFTRKVILSTNVAETSVTVPGVRYVVDSGVAKMKRFEVERKRYTLHNQPISKSSAAQRAGRAGRERAGKCFRLYTQKAFDDLELLDRPEIMSVDATDAVLAITATGVDALDFPLLSTPSRSRLTEGVLDLYGLGAISHQRQVTADGLLISRLPLPATYGRVFLDASHEECLLPIIDIIACLTTNGSIFLRRNEDEEDQARKAKEPRNKGDQDDRDENDESEDSEDGEDDNGDDRKEPLEGGSKDRLDEQKAGQDGRDEEDQLGDCDLLARYQAINNFLKQRRRGHKLAKWCRDHDCHEGNMLQAVRIRKQLIRLQPPDCKSMSYDDGPVTNDLRERILRCFLRGFAFNTAILTPDGKYKKEDGTEVYIHPSSLLFRRQTRLPSQMPAAILFIEQVQTSRNYARIVSGIDPGWIEPAKSHWT